MSSGIFQAEPSFRDPAGFLRVEADRALRTVNPEHASDTQAFLDSRLAREWTRRRRLIATEVLQPPQNGSPLHLAHPRIFFPSYPWEWTPAQLGAVAELTLDLCEDLIGAGWILKDATPSNVLLDGPRPVFVDLLSVERRNPEEVLWLAYGQFVRTFLLPLAAYRKLGWPLAATLTRRDGYEPEELYRVLGPVDKMRSPWCGLVTLPVLLGRRKSGETRQMRRAPHVAEAILRHSLGSLRRSLRSLVPTAGKSHWSGYQQSATHYSPADMERKLAFVRECLSLAGPHNVLDIGANTGFFSRIAATCGARVVAWDFDIAATEQAWREASREQLDVLPLVADFARPTPAAGWNNAETVSLLDRARGRFDMVMMLAILHHLLVREQIPMDRVASLTREMTQEWLLIEWVGPADEKFRTLSNGRDALYGHLTEQSFVASFSRYFAPVRSVILENGRSLHLFKVR